MSEFDLKGPKDQLAEKNIPRASLPPGACPGSLMATQGVSALGWFDSSERTLERALDNLSGANSVQGKFPPGFGAYPPHCCSPVHLRDSCTCQPRPAFPTPGSRTV